MHKKIIYPLLAVILFVFISVSFLIPSELNAETHKFWIDTSHWETEKEWVDTSHLKIEGHWETNKTWVDTSHMVYQGYWKNFTEKVWVDTSYWVYGGHYEDVTERVWVTSGYWAYRNVKKWIDTSHWEIKKEWVDTSHSEYVRSGYWTSKWVDTSHWEMRYRTVRQAYRVYVSSGYWKWYWSGWRLRRRWIDTSHWETRYRNVRQAYWTWVKSGYWKKVWKDTSHWTWVKSGYWKTKKEWVKSGYWTTVREPFWEDTSHWEDQKVWVDIGHYETRYKYVEDWQPCNVTFVFQLIASEPKNVILSKWRNDNNTYKGTINGKMYKYYKSYYDVLPGNNLFSLETIAHPWVIFKIKYKCFEVLSGEKESYSVWVPGGHWKRKWVDTSHWVKSGYWKYYTYRTWVDTSYRVEEGHWETEKVWVDTSHWVESGYWQDKDVWVEDGFYTSPLHGEVIVEKSPRYIFTRWHKDQNNEECSMELNVSWKVDNSNLSEGEEEKEIVRIYIYQDICRFNNKGIEKVTIFNGNVTPSVEGSINTVTKFDYSGSEESILHIYLYAQNGESAHVYFNNPINGFRSINLMSEGSNSDANTWLGGNNYGKFEF